MPAMPERTPSGIPMADSTAASYSTQWVSCRRVAPTEESRPNWRVRSETEMENALQIRKTDANRIMTMKIVPREYSTAL